MRLTALLLSLSLALLAMPAVAGSSAIEQSAPAPGHNFGNIPLGATYASQTFTFRNKGSSAVTLGQASIDAQLATCAALGCPVPSAGDFTLAAGSDNCSGKTLAAGASCSLLVGFVPVNGGPRIARLALPTSEPLTVESMLAGTGVKQPDDCILDWAEKTFPQQLSPAANSFVLGPYYARCYGNILCIAFDSVLPSFAPPSAYLYDGKQTVLIASQQALASQAACK